METLKFCCFFLFVYLRKPLEKYLINLRILYKTKISTYVYIVYAIYTAIYGASTYVCTWAYLPFFSSSSTIERPFAVAVTVQRSVLFSMFVAKHFNI